MEIISTTRGHLKLCYDGYMYTKKDDCARKDNRMTWRCVRRGTKYNGTITTTVNHEDPQPLGQHNHDPNPAEIEATKVRSYIRNFATQTQEKPLSVISAFLWDA